jgi:hypothetical protein
MLLKSAHQPVIKHLKLCDQSCAGGGHTHSRLQMFAYLCFHTLSGLNLIADGNVNLKPVISTFCSIGHDMRYMCVPLLVSGLH